MLLGAALNHLSTLKLKLIYCGVTTVTDMSMAYTVGCVMDYKIEKRESVLWLYVVLWCTEP